MAQDTDWVNVKVRRETRDRLKRLKDEFGYTSYADFIDEAVNLRFENADVEEPQMTAEHAAFRLAQLQERLDTAIDDLKHE
jgi:hypothetical protein